MGLTTIPTLGDIDARIGERVALTDERRQLLDDTFEDTVAPTLFGDQSGSDEPVAVLWVHPPWHAHGSGLHELNDAYRGRLVVVDGQALRGALPEYDSAMQHPLTAQEATREDVGHLVGCGIDYAGEHGISVLVPGTGTRPAVTLRTAADLQGAQFDVHVVAVAEPMESTRLDAVYGYFDPQDTARVWPRPDNRAANWDGLRETVDLALASPHVHRVVVTTKDGTVRADTSDPTSADPITEFDARRQLDLSPEQAERWLQRWHQALAWAQESGELNEQTSPVFAELTADAARMTAYLRRAGRAVAFRRLTAAVEGTGDPALGRTLLASVEARLTGVRKVAERAVAELRAIVDNAKLALSEPPSAGPALEAMRAAIDSTGHEIDDAIEREWTTVRGAQR